MYEYYYATINSVAADKENNNKMTYIYISIGSLIVSHSVDDSDLITII